MATRRTTLKPHLNQIRAWVAEGATDIWIAHKLEATPASIARFRRQHELTRGDQPTPSAPATAADAPRPAEPTVASSAPRPAEPAPDEPIAVVTTAATDEPPAAAQTLPRRRRRRGGRGRGESREELDTPIEFEGVFDHGEDGYGLWIDGAVRDAGVYRTHWQGHAAVVVRIAPDEITIRRAAR